MTYLIQIECTRSSDRRLLDIWPTSLAAALAARCHTTGALDVTTRRQQDGSTCEARLISQQRGTCRVANSANFSRDLATFSVVQLLNSLIKL